MMFELIKIELMKTKRSLALLMMFLCPLMVVLVNVLLFLNSGGKIVNEKGWGIFWLGNFGMWGYFMMPLYVALITALLNGIEHKYSTWRFMASLPVEQKQLFMVKFVLAFIYLVGANLVLFLGVFLVVALLKLFGFSGGDMISFLVIKKLLFTCIAPLSILTIGHMVSWRWQNIVLPLGLGVLATLSIMQFSSSKYWPINPWTYTLTATNSANATDQSLALIYSAIVTIVLLIFGRTILGKREITC